jgi:stage V sporulation protein B
VNPAVGEKAQEAPENKPDADVARSAGRGGLAVAFAKMYFILVGFVQQIALPRVLGLDGYGAFSSAQSIASITYNPITGTSIQGVSRAVAHATDAEQGAALRRTLTVHACFALVFWLAFFVSIPFICRAIGAPHIVSTLRILSTIVLLYGLYTPLVGALNGKRRFLSQAGLDIGAATLRTIGLVTGAYLVVKLGGSRLEATEGASWGFVVAMVMLLMAALFMVGVGRAGPGGPTVLSHLAFVGPLFLGQILLNLLLQADLTLLRRFAGEAAVAQGLPLTAADPFIGAYRATQLFSFLPYQLLLSVTFVLFPMLASAARDGDRQAVGRFVETGVRLALVIAGLMASVTSGLAGPLMRLVFGQEAANYGTAALQTLSLGFGVFAIFGILTTVLNSLKREGVSTLITLVAVLLVAAVCLVTVRGGELSGRLLLLTARATSTAIVLSTAVAGFFVFRTTGALVRPSAIVRVLLATALATLVGRLLPDVHPLAVVPFAALVGVVYAVVLVLTRELTRADLELVQHVIRRRAS